MMSVESSARRADPGSGGGDSWGASACATGGNTVGEWAGNDDSGAAPVGRVDAGCASGRA